MKKLLTILTTLFVYFSNFSLPVLAVSPPTNPANVSEESTYAIVSENYVGDWTNYYNFDYEFSNGMTFERVRFRVRVTYRYNEATGKVYGSPGTLFIEVSDPTYNDLCVFELYNIRYTTSLSSDGYAWIYSNITFDMDMGYIDPNKTFKNIIVLGTQYVPG